MVAVYALPLCHGDEQLGALDLVETARQRDGILAIGCENAQGNFSAAPLSAAAFAGQLGQHAHHNGRVATTTRTS